MANFIVWTRLTLYVYSMQGIPYIYGGENPSVGLDCSALIKKGLQYCGIVPENRDFSAQMLYDYLMAKSFQSCEPSEDCVLFFSPANSLNDIKHVALAISPLDMLEAAGGGRTTLTPEQAIELDARVQMSKISRRSDLVASIKVTY